MTGRAGTSMDGHLRALATGSYPAACSTVGAPCAADVQVSVVDDLMVRRVAAVGMLPACLPPRA